MAAPSKPRTPEVATTSEGIDELVTAMLTASRVLVSVSARSLAEIEDRVTVTQFRTLVVLDSQGQVNLNHLADGLGVTASTALRMVDRLLSSDLVTRRENPGNRREVLLDLTTAGRRLVRRVTATRRTEITRIVTAMPAGQRSTLVAALRSFAMAAGEADPQPDAATSLGW